MSEEVNISAFPRHYQASAGMTLRDYFAAAALQGLLASQFPAEGATNKDYANDSYRMADAMLIARMNEDLK